MNAAAGQPFAYPAIRQKGVKTEATMAKQKKVPPMPMEKGKMPGKGKAPCLV